MKQKKGLEGVRTARRDRACQDQQKREFQGSWNEETQSLLKKDPWICWLVGTKATLQKAMPREHWEWKSGLQGIEGTEKRVFDFFFFSPWSLGVRIVRTQDGVFKGGQGKQHSIHREQDVSCTCSHSSSYDWDENYSRISAFPLISIQVNSKCLKVLSSH